MLNLECELVCGRPWQWTKQRGWFLADRWWIVLADTQKMIVVPGWAIANPECLHAGDRGVIIELKHCAFTIELERELYRQEMERAK